MPPRKVLLVGPYPPPYGGLSVQLQQWQRYLRETHGWSCEVLNIGEKRDEPLPGAHPVHGSADFLRKLTKYARQRYLIHLFTNGHNLKSWQSALACALAGCVNQRRSLLVFGSGNLPEFIQGSGSIARAIAKTAGRLSGHIVCRNDEMRGALSKLGIGEEKISIVSGYYGAVDNRAELPSDIEAFINEHNPVLGAMATTMTPEYGIPLLLDAAQQLRQTHPKLGIVLIGIAENPTNDPNIYVAGPLPNPVALGVMSRLTAFIRPTLFDGDSRSVREALALGIPVVASDTGLRPAGVTLFPKADVAAMIQAIREVIRHRTIASTCQNTSAAAESVGQILALYDRILKLDDSCISNPKSEISDWTC